MTNTRYFESSQRPHWLCIAYAFPPINRSGTHRTLGFVKHLSRFGWDATVVTVEPKDETIDDLLLGQVPASTTVLRTRWTDPIERVKRLCRLDASRLKRSSDGDMAVESGCVTNTPCERSSARFSLREFVSRLLITPDSRAGWVRPAVSVGMKAIRRRRPDVLYSTSPYASAHLIALILKMRTGLPWVADFRDPWRDNPFRRDGYAILDRWDAWLERRVMRHATHVVCNTPQLRDHLSKRLSFVSDKCTTIMNGFDRELFEGIEPTRIAPADTFVLTHSGQFYGPRKPTVWLGALRRVLNRQPELVGKIQIALLGPTEYEGTSLRDLASSAGVGDHVKVLGSRPHAESLAHLAGSDALILAASDGPGADLQVPNKLFEYLAIRKPIIAAVSANSPAVDILMDAQAESIVCDPADEVSLANALTQLAKRRRVRVDHAWAGVDRFDRCHRAAELAEIFKRVSVGSSCPALPAPAAASGPASVRCGAVPEVLSGGPCL